MNVSLRSQMTAGVAALGAAVVAIAPITQPDLLPSAQRVAAAVELSAFSNPIIAISDTVFYAVQSIIDQGQWIDDLAWPDSFYTEDGFLYAPQWVGIIPNIVNQFSFGPLSALVNNLSGYGYAAAASAFALFNGVAGAAFNAPFAAVSAVQELIAGDPEAALQALVTGIVEPLQDAVEYALAGVGYIVDNIIENIQIVSATTLPRLVAGLIDSVVGSVSLIAGSLVETAASFVANLADLNIEGAWNDVVDGILGDNGTLGQIVQQTISIGQLEEPEGVLTVTVPSVFAVLTSEFQRLGDFKGEGGISNDPFFGPEAEATAAVPAPAPVAAVEVSAPAVALESAPAVVEAPAAPEAVVEAPAPVREPAVTTEVADVAPAVPAGDPAPVGEPDVTSPVSAVSEADTAPSPAAAPSQARVGDSDGAAASTPKRGQRGAKVARGAN